MENNQKLTSISFNDINDSIRHFESLQKRYMKTHNGKMCLRVEDALASMYFIKSIIESSGGAEKAIEEEGEQ